MVCLNFPLWIAVIILAVFGSWDTVAIIVGCNVASLLTSYTLFKENRREGKKVKQKVIKYLGTEPPTKEQIETIRRSKDASHGSEATQ